MALGVTACTEKIYDAFVSDDKTKTLFHGHSFTGNALACAASLASLELIQKSECKKNVHNIVEQHKKFAKKLNEFQKKDYVKKVRQIGTIIAFEISTSEEDNYLNSVAVQFTPFCMKRGVYLRSMGNTIYVMPPYCITSKQLKKVYSVVIEFIKTFFRQTKN